MAFRDIQKEILGKLLQSTGLRYSDARPKGVDNDLYNYHLQFLVKKGFVEKKDQLYHLTLEGKKTINDTVSLSQPSMPFDTFKVSVLCCLLKKENGKLMMLNQKRKRHPFYGDIGIISGKVRKEESVLDAASRKIFEETSLKAQFEKVGLIRKIRYVKNKQDFFSDSFWFICVADDFSGDLETENKFGENFWCDISTSIENEKKSSQGSEFIIDLYKSFETEGYKNTNFFYHEEFVVVDKV